MLFEENSMSSIIWKKKFSKNFSPKKLAPTFSKKFLVKIGHFGHIDPLTKGSIGRSGGKKIFSPKISQNHLFSTNKAYLEHFHAPPRVWHILR